MGYLKPEQRVLTYPQARELNWFCRNVVGIRAEYYSVMERALEFDKKIARLEKTCELIEKFFGEQLKNEPMEKVETETSVDLPKGK